MNPNWKQGFTQRPAWKVSPGEKRDKIGYGGLKNSKSIGHWESWNEGLTKLDHLRHSGNLGKYDDQPTASGGKNQAATRAPHCPSLVASCPQFVAPIIATPLPEPSLSLICGLFSAALETKFFTGLIFSVAHFLLWPNYSPAWFTIAFKSCIIMIILTELLLPCPSPYSISYLQQFIESSSHENRWMRQKLSKSKVYCVLAPEKNKNRSCGQCLE